jgi:integrase/recombinase XerD
METFGSMPALRGPINRDLARKFQQASQAKTLLEDFVHEFLEQYISDQTKRAYLADMKAFFDFLRSGGVAIHHPKEMEAYHFKIYRDHMIEDGLASATINRRLVCIRSFIKWAIAARLCTHNPLDQVKLPKVQTESPTLAFDDEEVVRMLNAPDLTTHKGRTHRLIMALLFNLGLRRSEVVNIRLEHIVLDRGHVLLRIHGKGDKTRHLPLSEGMQAEIEAYKALILRERGAALGPQDYLLQTEKHFANYAPMDGSTIWRIIDRYTKMVGIDKDVSPHSCRATVISHLLDTQFAPIRDVATMAGHTNISTTERYDKRRGNLDRSAAYRVNYGVAGEIKRVDQELQMQ